MLVIKNVTLSYLIAFAFKINSNQLAGKADFQDSQEFDVTATVDGGAELTEDQMLPLLQALLIQRFHLVFHLESKLTSGLEMIAAKGGPKLRVTKTGEQPRAQILPNAIQAVGMSLDSLAALLELPTGRPVMNGISLPGKFDIELDYAPESDADSGLPNIYSALEEQLGIKLIPHKVSAENFVIDHVDRIPTDN